MTMLCLVRHGETDWNNEGRYQGQSDVPLNDNGRAQARALGEKLRDETIHAIYSSDLVRARETAQIVASVLHLPVKEDARLREINQGEWEGQQVEVIKARYADLWQSRSVNPANVRPPGGETVREVARRVYQALDDIAGACLGESVLIVSHGLALATAICRVRALPVGQAYRFIPENAEPVWVKWIVRKI